MTDSTTHPAARTDVAPDGGPRADPLAGLAGPAALAAGAGLVVTQIVQLLTMNRDDMRATFDNPVYVANGVAQFVVFAVLLVAVVAAHQWHAPRAGRLGVVGLVAALVGILNLGGNYWFEAFVSPWAVDTLPGYLDAEPSGTLPVGGLTSYLLFAIGWVLFGIGAWRARTFPRQVSIALIVGGVVGVQMVQPPLGVPLGLALCWLGLWMLASRKRS